MLKTYICNVKTTSPTMFALLKVVYLCLTCLYVFKWRVVFSSPDTYARLCIHIHIMQYLDNTWANFKSKTARHTSICIIIVNWFIYFTAVVLLRRRFLMLHVCVWFVRHTEGKIKSISWDQLLIKEVHRLMSYQLHYCLSSTRDVALYLILETGIKR